MSVKLDADRHQELLRVSRRVDVDLLSTMIARDGRMAGDDFERLKE
jgi:hypothetical protein